MPATPDLSELQILSDVLDAGEARFSPDVARAVLRWRFSRSAVARMNRLAEKNRQGTMTPEEGELLNRFLRVGNLVNLVQAKARLSLRDSGADGT